MGREIRRVPANWDHPKYTKDNAPYENRIGVFKPIHDEDFDTALAEWLREYRLWKRGKHPDQKDPDIRRQYPNYWEWNGSPPDPDYYRPRWTKREATWWQVYETVSEGTPVTPPFATHEELVEYLVAHGDFWDQRRSEGPWSRKNAEAFVFGPGWAPSMVVANGRVMSGVEFVAE